MPTPAPYVGYGFSSSAYCRVMQEVGSADASLAIVVGAHQPIGCKGLILFGNDAQKQKWLPKLATGELIAAFALTEPEAGPAAPAQKTSPGHHPATTKFILNGTKQ